MQSRDCLWESHVKSDGPGSCVPLWQQMLLAAPMNALGSFPVLQKASWNHSPFCREQVGTKKFQLSTPRLLLCALSPLRPRSCSYLRTQIPFKKMSISKPYWYRNSFENMNSKGLKKTKDPEHAHTFLQMQNISQNSNKFHVPWDSNTER